MTTLVLPADLRQRIAREALNAFPNECCGLLEGERISDRVVVAAAHSVRNLCERADGFEIDPADHFRILRAARMRGTQIVGCYHSHPNGRAEPSQHDLTGANEVDFVWLIAATTAESRPALAAFLYDGDAFVPVSIEESGALDPARGLLV